MTQIVVSSGHISSGVALQSGDQMTVLSGGFAFRTSINSGATLTISSGAEASGTIVGSNGGTIQMDGGFALATTFAGSGTFLLSSGSTAVGTSLGRGAVMAVGDHAVASATSVGAFAILSCSAGTTSNTEVTSGGLEYDTFAAAAYGTVVASGGEQYGDGNAIALGTTVLRGGYQVVLNGAVASGSHVESGGKLIALEGGTVSSATIDFGGSVQSGGIVELRGTTVISAIVGSGSGLVLVGTSAFVLSGGLLQNATVSQSYLDVASAGRIVGATVYGGGSETVESGGRASGTILAWDSGASGGDVTAGVMSVLSGGSAIGTILQSPSNGTQPLGQSELDVASGASVASTAVSSGGLFLLSAGAQPTATDVFSGGQIDLVSVAYDQAGTASVNPSNDQLTVSENGQQTLLGLAGSYTNIFFHLASDQNGGTLVTADGTPCFRSGTNIKTPQGDVAVENLNIGDKVLNLAGKPRPIRWIGRRSYQAQLALGRTDLIPICFRAGSLAPGVPQRDLQVSPLHAMYIDGSLIPAAALVNQTSVFQATDAETIHYFHIELDTHDIIFAEGAPTETYLDEDNRPMFSNAPEYERHFTDRPSATPYAPRITDGPLLASIRRRLCGLDHITRAENFNGVIDVVTRDDVTGWAIDLSKPSERQRLRVLVDGITIGETRANLFRADLAQTGLGDGVCSFQFKFPGGLQPGRSHFVEVVRVDCGTSLVRSPVIFHVPTPLMPCFATTPLLGNLDYATREGVSGWAREGADTSESTALQIVVDGEVWSYTLANRFRADVAAAMGEGWCGFALDFQGGLSSSVRHVIQVQRASDGLQLAGSPVFIEAAHGLNGAMQNTICGILEGLATSDEREQAIAFLDTQAERVRQLQADADSERAKRTALALLRHQLGVDKARKSRGRALVIDPRYPVLSRDTGSAALLSHIEALLEFGYQVSFVAADEMQADCPLLQAIGVTCWRGPTYSSVEEVLRRQSGCLDLVYLHRIDMASAYASLVRRTNKKAKLVYSVADLHHLRLEGQAVIEERPELTRESRRVKLEELSAAMSADVVVTHSSEEMEVLKAEVPAANVHVVPWAITPIGCVRDLTARVGVAFVGSFAHAPNVDAAHFLVREVMPLVWEQDPSIPCILVGQSAPPGIAALAGAHVLVLGHVADLEEVWERVRMSVAPLRYGAGIKGKVLDSMAAGIPCIMSPVAAQGLPLGEDLRAGIADGAPAFAKQILRLHSDDEALRRTCRAGLKFVTKHFSYKSVVSTLGSALAISASSSPPPNTDDPSGLSAISERTVRRRSHPRRRLLEETL